MPPTRCRRTCCEPSSPGGEMDYEQIRFEVRDAVATVTLHRPERLNAYTSRMGAELRDAFRVVDARDDVRAVVVTGAGRGFCAGADLEGDGKIFREGEGAAAEPPPAAWEVRKPIIGAINGPAVGVGATLPLQWDIRLAGESARIGFVFVRRGLVPEAASTWILPRLVGMARAAELLGVAHALAREIAEHTAPVAVALTKRMLWAMQDVPGPAEAAAIDLPAFRWTTQTADAREGIRAFLEKRPPRWTMRPSVDLPDLSRFRA